jgi:peptide deformylase
VAKDLRGASFETDLEDMHAICVQHEVDHLHGKLFIDRVSRLRKLRLRNKLQLLEKTTVPTAEVQTIC